MNNEQKEVYEAIIAADLLAAKNAIEQIAIIADEIQKANLAVAIATVEEMLREIGYMEGENEMASDSTMQEMQGGDETNSHQ